MICSRQPREVSLLHKVAQTPKQNNCFVLVLLCNKEQLQGTLCVILNQYEYCELNKSAFWCPCHAF